jgi:hypothetical protein
MLLLGGYAWAEGSSTGKCLGTSGANGCEPAWGWHSVLAYAPEIALGVALFLHFDRRMTLGLAAASLGVVLVGVVLTGGALVTAAPIFPWRSILR